MERTTLHHLVLNLTVNTSHGSELEFVLDDTNDRTNRNYYDELWLFVNKQLESTESTVFEYGAYGHVWLTVQVRSVEEIPMITELVNRGVDRWIKRFNVERMKRNSQ